MKNWKKVTAAVLSAGMLIGILPVYVQAAGGKTSTVVEADGTIHTNYVSLSGDSENSYYPVNRDGVYKRYDYPDSYILNVVCKDAEAFETEFSQEFDLYQLEDGSYFVFKGEWRDGYPTANDIQFFCSEMTYDEVIAMMPLLQESANVESIAVQRGYKHVPAGRFEVMSEYWIYSETELTAEDFDWAVEMGYTILSIEASGDQYRVNTENPTELDYWEGIYTFMLHCMDMPTVYAVNDFMYEQAIMRPVSYETVAVYENIPGPTHGDINFDSKVSVLDAITLSKANIQAITLNESQTAAADCNGDGLIDSADVTVLLCYLTDKVDALPVTIE